MSFHFSTKWLTFSLHVSQCHFTPSLSNYLINNYQYANGLAREFNASSETRVSKISVPEISVIESCGFPART